MSNPLNYISIARKAGSIEIGETNCGAVVRGGKAKLLLLASDASDNARRRADNYVYGRKTVLITVPYTKEQLSSISGVSGFSMAAFTDVGLASAFLSRLSENYPKYAEQAEKLALLNDRAQQRKSEARAHDKNKKLGSAKASASEKRRKNK